MNFGLIKYMFWCVFLENIRIIFCLKIQQLPEVHELNRNFLPEIHSHHYPKRRVYTILWTRAIINTIILGCPETSSTTICTGFRPEVYSMKEYPDTCIQCRANRLVLQIKILNVSICAPAIMPVVEGEEIRVKYSFHWITKRLTKGFL